MVCEPGEVLADDVTDLLVGRRARPEGRRRSAGDARHARQWRHSQHLVLIGEQAGPAPKVGKELVEPGSQNVRVGNLLMGLLDVLHHVDDLAEHLIQRRDRIVGFFCGHAGHDAPIRRRSGRTQGVRSQFQPRSGVRHRDVMSPPYVPVDRFIGNTSWEAAGVYDSS